MADSRKHHPAAHEFREALRQARATRGLSSRDLSTQLGYSHAVVSTFETGRGHPTPTQLAEIIEVLEITGEERDTLLDLAANAASPIALIPGIPEQLADVISYERTCTAIKEWSPTLVPDLLQTSSYTKALWAHQCPDAPEVESRGLVQAGRREILTRQTRPVQYLALISAAVLREPIAPPSIMAEQVNFLITHANIFNITIRVVPMFAGWHPGVSGPLSVYLFPSGHTSFRRNHDGTSCVVTSRDAELRSGIDQTLSLALDREDSIMALKDAAAGWQSQCAP